MGHKERQYLEGKKGIYVDSPDASGYFSGFIESLGGHGETSPTLPDGIVEQAKILDFLIIHHYGLEDQDNILKLCEEGVKVLMLQREQVLPELKNHYDQMYQELSQAGATIKPTFDRVLEIKRFLERKFFAFD